MQIDTTLRRKVARQARDNVPLRILLGRYEQACLQTRGTDADRVAYWEQRALFLEGQLWQAITALALERALNPRLGGESAFPPSSENN